MLSAGGVTLAPGSADCCLLNAESGRDFFISKGATLGALDGTKGTVAVAYRLTSSDVSVPGTGRIRWTLSMLDGGIIHAPGSRDRQTHYRINS